MFPKQTITSSEMANAFLQQIFRSTYYQPGTVLDAEDTAEQDKVPALLELKS